MNADETRVEESLEMKEAEGQVERGSGGYKVRAVSAAHHVLCRPASKQNAPLNRIRQLSSVLSAAILGGVALALPVPEFSHSASGPLSVVACPPSTILRASHKYRSSPTFRRLLPFFLPSTRLQLYRASSLHHFIHPLPSLIFI
jgi:hypothetical protein